MERSLSAPAHGLSRRLRRRTWFDAAKLAGIAQRLIDLNQRLALHDMTASSEARPRPRSGKEFRTMLRVLGLIAALIVASIVLAGN
ncbi:MAG TPA: hypothetical protein VMF62_10540 [Acetobacteraceae bacterium]|jgi:hypothetical protein|nr:hypothetical protein [Acetobacteraceae bacterium]